MGRFFKPYDGYKMPVVSKDKKREVKSWVLSPDCDDCSIVLTFYPAEPNWVGFSIIANKRVKRLINYEHVILEKKTCEKLIADLTKSFRTRKLHEYYDCTCLSEIIRVNYWYDENEITFDIFDNYIHKCKRGVKDYISLSVGEAVILRAYLEEVNNMMEEVKDGRHNAQLD